MLHVTEINDVDHFLEMKKTWNEVLDKSNDNNVYLTWEYLSTYWKHFGKNRKLRILCLEDGTHIIGMAPLRQQRLKLAGPVGYELIEPLAYRGLMPEGADYTGIILTERETECLHSLFNYLANDGSWDFMYLMDVQGTSTIPSLLNQMSNSIPFRFETGKGAICPYMLLPNSPDALMKSFGPRVRKNLRRQLRNLQSDFHSVELKKYNALGSVQETMESFFELHQKSCKNRGLPGVFATQEVRNFYTDVARQFADNGWLALYFLTVDDRSVAAYYCFEYSNKMLYALSGFDPDYSSYSVGNLLLLKIIEKSIAKGLGELDFLKGDEAYKFRWTSSYRQNLKITFVNNKFTSNLYNFGISNIKRLKMSELLQRSLVYS